VVFAPEEIRQTETLQTKLLIGAGTLGKVQRAGLQLLHCLRLAAEFLWKTRSIAGARDSSRHPLCWSG
jgi:hypothetical protein